MYKTANIAIEKSTFHFDHLYTYYLPIEMVDVAKVGCRVTVPFGRGNQKRQGIILQMGEVSSREQLKPILSLTDPIPLLNKEMLSLLVYLKKNTFCSYFDALKVLLPPGIAFHINHQYLLLPDYDKTLPLNEIQTLIVAYLQLKSVSISEKKLCEDFNLDTKCKELNQLVDWNVISKNISVKRKIQDEKIAMVRLTGILSAKKPTPKQQLILNFLSENGDCSIKEICYKLAITKAVLSTMLKNNMLEFYEQDGYRNPYAHKQITIDPNKPTLSPNQIQAYEQLRSLLHGEKLETALLFGVTGSGKTQIFLNLIEDVIAKGKTAIVLVPEIALTPQTIHSFHCRFGEKIAVIHSALSGSNRTDEWKRIKDGLVDIVVGTRSAIFAPLENIGIIVLDEEQEHTYKSEQSPRFHAKNIAMIRAKTHNALVVLASATPSVESYYLAQKGKYHLVKLTERFTGSVLPMVNIVDMKEQKYTDTSNLSDTLIDEMHLNLQNKEQTILLLNRRGHSTVTKCSSCGEVAVCPNCSVSLTYHSANNQIICHYCGYFQDTLTNCQHCNSEYIRFSGTGTQRIEEELTTLFPTARILRMDMDTTLARFSHEKLFNKFALGEYDIMIGTQMVAKGLNFPNVTLVGVLAIDQTLYSQDFRNNEKTFSLLTQVVGRSGRGNKLGRAFIQTYTPENQTIALACTQQYEAFFSEEISFRKINLYPPFCDIIGVSFISQSESTAKKAATYFTQILIEEAKLNFLDIPLRLLGPSQSSIFKIAGKYRYKLILKSKKNHCLRDFLTAVLTKFTSEKQFHTTIISIDTHYDDQF